MSESTEDTAPGVSENPYELLDYAFELITEASTDEMLNPLLCGYFTKLMMGLLENKKNEFLKYLSLTSQSSPERKRHPDLLKLLVDHVYDRSIAELVSKIIKASQGVFSIARAMEMEDFDDPSGQPQ